jgi:hypothetical protein
MQELKLVTVYRVTVLEDDPDFGVIYEAYYKDRVTAEFIASTHRVPNRNYPIYVREEAAVLNEDTGGFYLLPKKVTFRDFGKITESMQKSLDLFKLEAIKKNALAKLTKEEMSVLGLNPAN